jgi:hypothetical protein
MAASGGNIEMRNMVSEDEIDIPSEHHGTTQDNIRKMLTPLKSHNNFNKLVHRHPDQASPRFKANLDQPYSDYNNALNE